MKGYIIDKPKNIVEKDVDDSIYLTESSTKVKITKTLLRLSDILRYNGEIENSGKVLGSTATGIVTETNPNSPLTQGNHVYIKPTKPCMNCYNCINEDYKKCSDMHLAGEDFDGFLCDFATVPSENLFILPESVSDLNALFISDISLAISIIDKLHVGKGDYVAVVGGDNFGLIISELLIYYQAVPILCTLDKDEYDRAKSCGIYYVLDQDDNWQKEVSSFTSGRMARRVVYDSDSNIPATRMFSLAAFGARVAYSGSSFKNTSFSFTQAIKKQLNIKCLNNDFNNIETAINLIANGAINLSKLKVKTKTYEEVPNVLNEMQTEYEEKQNITETVIEMI